MAFTFAPARPARAEGDLAGLERIISSAVGRALKEDSRPRAVVAGAVSALLGEDVSKFMLDAYASEAREGHSISAGRFLALMAATERLDILDAVISRIGGRVLVGEEFHTARVGHLMAQKQRIDEELRALRPITTPIERGSL
jgi:hypothetical protein